MERYHPLFLYESLLTLLGGLLLLYIARKYKDKLFIGDLFLMYLVYYPFIRFDWSLSASIPLPSEPLTLIRQ